MIKHASVHEAHQRQQSGDTYVDVRSVPEFAQGHPSGALNVPLLHADERTRQMQPNAEFVAVMRANFKPDAPLLIGCQAGVRSLHACQALEAAGFTNLTNVLGGYAGSRMGDAGWAQAGLPVETSTPEGHDYASLQDTARRTAE